MKSPRFAGFFVNGFLREIALGYSPASGLLQDKFLAGHVGAQYFRDLY